MNKLIIGGIAIMATMTAMAGGEIRYGKVEVEDCKVFYREAGDKAKPTILLLHGFPAASHMFRELMPELADTSRSKPTTRKSPPSCANF